jgi:tetratricopeptide (TPR) repeat protein
MSQQASRNGTRAPRPWVVPPALLVSDEPFEGFHVLEEVADDLGVLLWHSLRDVDLWAGASVERRHELFAAGSLRARDERIRACGAADRPIRSLLEGVSRALGASPPAAPREMAGLCAEVSRWADGRGLLRTALAWAQRGAMAAPELAGPACLAGSVARRMADLRRAETWFRRALALARRGRDWKHYGMAHLGLAAMYQQRGDGPRARARLLQALRAARRHGVWVVKPLALHELFRLAANGGEREVAESYARAAFQSYGRRHARLPALAHDVAWFWMLQGEHERALGVFEAVLAHLEDPTERIVAWSNVGRAAGGAGRGPSFDRAWHEVWRAANPRAGAERLAEAMVNLAHGAAALGDPTRVETAAGAALTIARRRNEARELLEAEGLLSTARSLPAPPSGAPVAGDPRERARLAADMIEALAPAGAGP